MALLNEPFDANEVEPNAPYEVVPAGTYTGQITASEMQSTQNGNGQFLKLEIELTDGGQAGRKLFDRLNLVNPNAQAVDIAKRTLSAICHAVGKLAISDSDELHMRPFAVKVAVEPRNDRPGEYSNVIKGYSPVNGATVTTMPTRQAGAKPAVASPPAPAASTPPWKRKSA